MSDVAASAETLPLLRWQIGDVTVSRVPETEWTVPADMMLPEATVEALRKHSWLAPNFVTPEGLLRLSFHALAVEAPGLKLVVDTCYGENKTLPHEISLPGQGLFLKALASAGFAREDVGFVLCTHLHLDHVGWNTMLVDGAWVPTFPNARYLIGETEHGHWTSMSKEGEDAMGQADVMRESVAPIVSAGLADFIASDHRLSPELRLVPTPGHTPGHVSLLIQSRGERAVITGDMLHHPCQIPHPEWRMAFDSDGNQASATREQMLADWEATGALVIGTHFAAPTAGRIVREGGVRRFFCRQDAPGRIEATN